VSYSINLWCSHPDEGNDDCNVGYDFDIEAEALACYANPAEYFRRVDLASAGWIEMTLDCGPSSNGGRLIDQVCIRKNPDHRPTRDDDDAWRREAAMQAGMAFGCDGYNDVMGY